MIRKPWWMLKSQPGTEEHLNEADDLRDPLGEPQQDAAQVPTRRDSTGVSERVWATPDTKDDWDDSKWTNRRS